MSARMLERKEGRGNPPILVGCRFLVATVEICHSCQPTHGWLKIGLQPICAIALMTREQAVALHTWLRVRRLLAEEGLEAVQDVIHMLPRQAERNGHKCDGKTRRVVWPIPYASDELD